MSAATDALLDLDQPVRTFAQLGREDLSFAGGISVSVDVLERTRRLVAAAEQRVVLDAARAADLTVPATALGVEP